MLRAGRGSPQHMVLALMSIWVASPFVLLFAADARSIRWRRGTRLALYGLMIVISSASVVIYATDTLRPAHAPPAALFVAVPPLSWFVIAVSLGIAAITSRAD